MPFRYFMNKLVVPVQILPTKAVLSNKFTLDSYKNKSKKLDLLKMIENLHRAP